MTRSPGLDLVLACCRWPPSPGREAAVHQAAARGPAWPEVEALAARHRVAALVSDGLTRAAVSPPQDVGVRLARAAAEARRTALLMARETVRLQRAFDAAGVAAVFVKGSTLARLAYDDLGAKQSWDIDLLTTPDRLHEARRLLESLGYVMTPQDHSDAVVERLKPLINELILFNAGLGVAVELHWRLVMNDYILTGLDATDTQEVSLAGAPVRTLADPGLYAYLCVHGAYHAWARVKWLADVAAFLARRSGPDVVRLHDAATALGAGRASASALILCRDLFGLSLEPGLSARLDREPVPRRLAAIALQNIARTGEPAPWSGPGIQASLSRYLLVPDLRFKLAEARLAWTCPHDRLTIRLPPGLGFLYHLIRIPSWIVRSAGALMRRRRP